MTDRLSVEKRDVRGERILQRNRKFLFEAETQCEQMPVRLARRGLVRRAAESRR